MTVAIGFDPASGTIIIQGNGAFPARSLVATVSTSLPNTIAIKDLGGRGEQTVFCDDLTSLDGSFHPAGMADALAYLQGEFSKSLSPSAKSFEQLAYVDGAQALRLPAIPGNYRALFINGLRQGGSAFSISGTQVVLPPDLRIMAGDTMTFDYSTT